MCNCLGYAHLAPSPLTIDSEAVNALLHLIGERDIKQVLHLNYSLLAGGVWQLPIGLRFSLLLRADEKKPIPAARRGHPADE